MPKRRRSQPEISDIVALAHALDQDQRRTPAELAAREKRLAPLLPHDREDPVAVGLSWLDMMAGEDEAVRSIHQRADTALQLTGFLIVVIAILLGWGATLGAFYFDGSGRVNAVSVLALLVVVPALFLLPFVIATLPSRIAERVPGVGLVTALAGAVSPGRLAPLLWRVFPRDLRESMALITGRVGKHHRLYASLQKWAVLRWSQLFALTFQLTALAACLILVVFTDLAFGWSTTLTTGDARVDAQRVHRVTSAMALPWSWALDDAQPSLQLIEESRYFRVAAEPVSSAQAARLGGWWRFVVLSIAVYGLLPRVITFSLARSRLRAAARAAVVAGPGLSAVLRRIHRAQIESAAIEPEAASEHVPLTEPAERAPAARSAGHIRAVINWAGVPESAGRFSATFPGAKTFEAGGAAAVAEDLALAEQINTAIESSDDAVLIVVKAWEPPLMEFIDFLVALRAALTVRATMILVLPVGLDDAGGAGLPPATPAQLNLWRNKLAAIGDPWLRVVSTAEEVLT